MYILMSSVFFYNNLRYNSNFYRMTQTSLDNVWIPFLHILYYLLWPTVNQGGGLLMVCWSVPFFSPPKISSFFCQSSYSFPLIRCAWSLYLEPLEFYNLISKHLFIQYVCWLITTCTISFLASSTQFLLAPIFMVQLKMFFVSLLIFSLMKCLQNFSHLSSCLKSYLLVYRSSFSSSSMHHIYFFPA